MRGGVHSLERGPDDHRLARRGAVALDGPRRGIGEVLVRVLHGVDRELAAPLNLQVTHRLLALHAQQVDVEHRFRNTVRDDTAAVFVAQVSGAVHQVAKDIREITVVNVNQVTLAERNVAAVHRVAHQVIPEGIGRVPGELLHRVDNITDGLGHLLAIRRGDESVSKHRARERQPRGPEHARPDDAVEPDDVLADDVHARRPHAVAGGLFRPAGAGEVICQRVEPDIHDVARRVGNRDAPIERGPRHGQIA